MLVALRKTADQHWLQWKEVENRERACVVQLALHEEAYRALAVKHGDLTGLYDWAKASSQSANAALERKTEDAQRLRLELAVAREDLRQLQWETRKERERRGHKREREEMEALELDDDERLPSREWSHPRVAPVRAAPAVVGSAPKRPSVDLS